MRPGQQVPLLPPPSSCPSCPPAAEGGGGSGGGRDEVSLAFRNVFLSSHLLAAYSKGAATFKSDSPSAIAILKEAVTANATACVAGQSGRAELP